MKITMILIRLWLMNWYKHEVYNDNIKKSVCMYLPKGLERAEWGRRGTVTKRNRRKTEGLIL
jgi:hypothetical protein